MNKETIIGSCDIKGLFKAKNLHPKKTIKGEASDWYKEFEVSHPELLCYNASNELVTDVENVEVREAWRCRLRGFNSKWNFVEPEVYDKNTFEQYREFCDNNGAFAERVYQAENIKIEWQELFDGEWERITSDTSVLVEGGTTRKIYITVPPTELTDAKPFKAVDEPEAQPLEGVKTAQSILSATGKTISTITHIELLQCMEEYANYRIAQFTTDTRHHLTDEELLKAMQDYHSGQLGTGAGEEKESIEKVRQILMQIESHCDLGSAYEPVQRAHDLAVEALHWLGKAVATPSTHSSSEMVEVRKP